MDTVMDSIRSAVHGIVVFLSTVLDPVIDVLDRGGTALRRVLADMNVPLIVQPVAVIAFWLLLILALIRFLRGFKRFAALALVALLLLRIYRVLPDI